MTFARLSGLLGSALLVAAAPLPPYTAAYEPQTVDERGLWMQVDEYERGLRNSNLLIRDEALNTYVRRVLCQTVGEDRCRSVRIHLLELPYFNASMFPNGAMTVNSGLLLRVRSEAELGAVLGHEFGHFELRHSLNAFKRARGTTDALAWISLLGAASGTSTANSQYALIGAFYSFNREQEKQADLLGLAYLRASPYPASSAADIWAHLMAEQDATAAERKYKQRHSRSAGFFDTHPAERDRAEYLRAAAGDDPGDPGVSGHLQAIGPLLPRLLAAQIKAGDFGGSTYLLDALLAGGASRGDVLMAKADLYRERGNPRDLATAAQLYAEAINAGCTAPAARRGLGLALMRGGDASGGRTALTEYLRMQPDAGDAKLIQSLIAQ